MLRRELIATLVSRFTDEEWAALEDKSVSGELVNEFNRSALVRMRHCETGLDDELAGDEARELDAMLTDYMATYMTERPAAQKYFVASCLSLAFVLEEPMHPVERVQAVAELRGGRTVYHCPSKVTGERNICDFCVCEALTTS